MLQNDAPRPTFLVPRVLETTGGAGPDEYYVGLGVFGQVIPDSQHLKAWWAAFEPLMMVLNLAGYDTPEIVFGYSSGDPEADPDSYLRLLAWPGVIAGSSEQLKLEEGDWNALVGADAVLGQDRLDGQLVSALRVEARRWDEQPLGGASPYPALPLAGVTPSYIADARTPAPETADAFATPADGWLVFSQPLAVSIVPAPTGANARLARDAIAAALTAPAGAAAGLRARLDPATWTTALQRAYPIDAFVTLAAEAWRYLSSGTILKAFLAYGLDDPRATLAALIGGNRGVSAASLTDVDVDFFHSAREALANRHAALYPKEVNGPTLLADFENKHWIVALFALHEYGLIDLLPFAVSDPAILPDSTLVGDLPPVDMTGLYETAWGVADGEGRLVNLTMQINQGGDRLDGWIADRRLFRHEFTAVLDTKTYQPSAGVAEAQLRFAGGFDDDPDGWMEISDVRHPDADTAFEVVLRYATGDESASDLTTVRQTRRARLRPSLAGDVMPADVVAALDFGLSPDLPAWQTPRGQLETDLTPLHTLSRHGFDTALQILLQDLTASWVLDTTPPVDDEGMPEIGAQKPLDETAQGMLLTLSVNGVLDDAEVPADTTPILDRFRREAQQQLGSQVVSVGTTFERHLHDRLVDEPADSQLMLALLGGAVGDLDGTGAPETALHEYEFRIYGVGPSGTLPTPALHLEGGAFAIYCPLQHLAVCKPLGTTGPHGWEQPETYLGGMLESAGGFSAGQGKMFGVTTQGDPNTLITRGEWARDDFAPSTMLIASATATATGPLVSGAPPSGGYLPLQGTQYECIVFISARGRAVSLPTDNTGWNVKYGAGVELSVSYTIGGTLGFIALRSSTGAVLPLASSSFSDALGPDLELGDFAVGGWELTPGMRALLASAVARYRPLLETPESVLQAEADASTTGPTGDNEQLTWKRALAAYAWVHALLSTAAGPAVGTSTALAAGTNHVLLTGNGEMKAHEVGRLADEVEDDAWRRVKVKINDQVIVFL